MRSGAVRLAVLVLLGALLLSLSASGAGGVVGQREQGFSGVVPSRGAGPDTAARGEPSLASIDELVFSNQYEKAEQAYSAVLAASPSDVEARAAHAVFLAYAGELARSLSEARAAVALAPSDGRARAALCRALDWNGSVAEAAAAGRRAVSLSPDDPLAQLFAAEALADSGAVSDAHAALDAASRLVGPSGPAYLRAEVHRETANLDHDQGNALGQIGELYAAEAVQPTWAERVVELAGALFEDGDVGKGHTEFTRALSLRGDDVGLLLSLGGSALLAADYRDASVAYGRAGQLAPEDVEALHGEAQVAMASRGDSVAAADFLAHALRVDPSDYAAAAYLLYIARDVWRDEARGMALIRDSVASARDVSPPRSSRVVAVPDVDAVVASHAQRALAVVNATRHAAGLPPVRLDDRLMAAAVAHSFYWLFNQARPSQQGLGIHGETPGTPGFSGAGVYDRDNAFGWTDGPVGEDITHVGPPEAAVADWVDSVYHRFPILRPDLRVIGYADASMLTLPIEDMEFGFSGSLSGAPVRYPGDGAIGVPAIFADNELPDPVPPGAARTTGYPVTVTFVRGSVVRMSSFTLTGPGGAAVPLVAVQGPSESTENSAFLLPAAPLAAGARYVAHIVAVVDGAPYVSTWSFTVASSAG